MTTAIDCSMTVREAGPIWLESRRGFIADRSIRGYSFDLKHLYAVLGDKRLADITADDIRQFQQIQMQKISASRINKQTSVLQQMLKRVKLWGRLVDDFEPLPLPAESRGRALSDEEEYRLFKVASLNPNWETTYYAALLSANTAAGPGEIRHLKLKDVFVGDAQSPAWIKIREESAKNKYRIRTIPLNQDGREAVLGLLRLGKQRGASSPEHYLLPKQTRPGNTDWKEYFDPTQCLTTFKTSWKGMCAAADIQDFRMYDLRHHCLTRLAEKNPEEVVLKIAGHSSPAMLRKIYSHVRDKAVLEAVSGLSRRTAWKPSARAIKQLTKPSRRMTVQASVTMKRRAEQLTAEAEDTSWIEFTGGQ